MSVILPTQPSSDPGWTETNPGVRTEPSGSYKITGWFSNIRPPYQYMNWLFYNITEWIRWAQASIVLLNGQPAGYDFAVGSGGDFADINAAMASGSVVAGARLLVISNLSLTATQVINKANISIDFLPGVTISKGTAATGIQISASGVRLRGGRISGFSAGGNIAILIDAGSNYSTIGEFRFASNDTDTQDLNGKGATYGVISE